MNESFLPSPGLSLLHSAVQMSANDDGKDQNAGFAKAWAAAKASVGNAGEHGRGLRLVETGKSTPDAPTATPERNGLTFRFRSREAGGSRGGRVIRRVQS